jgi:hypothetical protein
MVAASFLSSLFLALAVAASPFEKRAPLAKLSFAKRVTANMVGRDQGLKSRAVINSQADNRAITYIATVGVGSPPTNCK